MKTRTLVLSGDLWHSRATARHGLKAMGDCDFDFEFLKNSAHGMLQDLKNFPLIVLAKSNIVSAKDKRPWLARDLAREFYDHTRRGNGLVVIHSGTAGYAELPAMRELIGGTFLSHPPQCAMNIEPKRQSSLTKGIASFTVQDEHYFVKLDDARNRFFLHSHSRHGVQPAGWTRIAGKGRVCVLTPGHDPEVWLHPEFQKLLLNVLRWTAKLN